MKTVAAKRPKGVVQGFVIPNSTSPHQSSSQIPPQVQEALEATKRPAHPAQLGPMMMKWVQVESITTDPQFVESAEVLKLVKGLRDKIEEERKRLTKPLLEVKAHIDANAKVTDASPRELEAHLKSLQLSYESTKREEAIKAANKLAARVEKSSPQAAEEIRQQALVNVVAPEVSGLSFRTTRKARVFDLLSLVRAVAAGRAPIECLEANEKFLGAFAKTTKGDSPFEGVEFYEERNVASGSYRS